MSRFVKIQIPTTPSIASFVTKIHPNKIIASYSNPMGLTMYCILTYRNKCSHFEIDMIKYSSAITIYIPCAEMIKRGGKIVRQKAITAIEAYITKKIYAELEKQFLIKSNASKNNKKHTIKTIIEEFQDEYSLCLEEFNYLRLHQHIIRFKRKRNIDTVSN